jgi:hypothetical protein
MIIAVLLLTQLCCCTTQKETQSYFGEKYFENPRGHVYSESKIWFKNDSTFKFVGSGPSMFLSEGRWLYDRTKREIKLITDNKLRPSINNYIDTMWVDLSGKNIKVLSKTKILFEDKLYYLTP